MQAPTVIIRNLLRQEWTPSNTPYDVEPPIHTGWFGDINESPQVTVTNPDESGDYEATDGATGGAVQRVNGGLLVNCWAGSRPTVEDDPDASTDNPKALAYQWKQEVARICREYATGTYDSGEPELRHLKAANARRLIDRDRTDPVVRYEVEVEYGYDNRP